MQYMLMNNKPLGTEETENMTDVVIVDAVRSAVGRATRARSRTSAPDELAGR
jgi:hypothetical protein